MKNLLLLLAFIFSTQSIPVSNQVVSTRTIKGLVVDETNSPVIFANVVSMCAGTGTQTDLEGRFSLMIPDSCHFLDVSYTGMVMQRVDIVGKDSVVVVLKTGVMLDAVQIIAYKVPLIEQDNTTQGGVMTVEQIRNLPTKHINSIAASTAGLSSTNGSDINVRSSRSNATDYYLDGIRVSGKPQKEKPATAPKANQEVYNREDYGLIVENTFQDPGKEPLSTFSVDVDAASYANTRRFLNNHQLPPQDAIRIEEMVNYFDYEYPQPTGDKPIAIVTEVSKCPWNTAHKLVHIGIQGKEIPLDDLPASNLVFLLDVSGSMNEENKLPLVISSFKILTEQLRAIDRVAIVVYAGSSGLVLPSTPGDKKQEILEALEKLRAGGSTAGAAGIQQAYAVAMEHFIEGGNNRVILATDGDFNVGVSGDDELVALIEKKRESGIFLTVLGFGTGNYMDNKMQMLADHGNGNHGYVDNITEAKKVFVNEFGGTLFTIAKDVKIQVEFNPALVSSYRLIGYENRLLAAEDFNDDKKDAGEIGSNHTVTALYEIIPTGDATASGRSVDELKYQRTKKPAFTSHTDELLTVKFRYKDPDGDISKLIEQVILDIDQDFESRSKDFRFSAAVASFGMLLRESAFAGSATLEDITNWASHSIGHDLHGYRKEFLSLVNQVHLIPEYTVEK